MVDSRITSFVPLNPLIFIPELEFLQHCTQPRTSPWVPCPLVDLSAQFHYSLFVTCLGQSQISRKEVYRSQHTLKQESAHHITFQLSSLAVQGKKQPQK